MDFLSADGAARWQRVREARAELLVGLDFDGVLAPIVADPDQAHIHPEAAELLLALAPQVRQLAVVTGRPARQALALGGLDEIGARIAEHGRELIVLGQYGNERWTSHERRVVTPKPPRGLASFERELPAVLRRVDAGEAWLEEKGLAVGIHTRRLPDPAAALDRLRTPIAELAARHGLTVEPGRMVLEVRAPGMDKGLAVRELVRATGAGGVVFVGDDLGDVAAFDAVHALRDADGLAGLTAYSRGAEVVAPLRERADLEVPGPDGVMALLAALTA